MCFGNHWYHISWLTSAWEAVLLSVLCLFVSQGEKDIGEREGRAARKVAMGHSLFMAWCGRMLEFPRGQKDTEEGVEPEWTCWLPPKMTPHLQPQRSVRWAMVSVEGEEELKSPCCAMSSPSSSKFWPLREVGRLRIRYEMGVYIGLN